MALSMYLHMLCRSAINPLILIFSKNYFCEQTSQTYLQGSKLTGNSIKKVREAVSTPSKFCVTGSWTKRQSSIYRHWRAGALG